ncbi:MAG: hypothetical protein QNJ70_16855 [Xenococcaceae cyanobacterium MO_207.B15]|nr:hypothetical protein [Xenococcaceae cyanobacterium MO_207.B15]
MDSFAIVTLKLEPYQDKKLVIFDNQISEIDVGYAILYPQQNKDCDTINTVDIICQGICAGIETACIDLKEKQHLVRGIKVTGIAAKYHPIDSRSHSYQITTHLALLEAFEQVGLTKMGIYCDTDYCNSNR